MRPFLYICFILLTFNCTHADVKAPLEMKLKLTKLTPPPKISSIGTYSRAMSIYEYQILDIIKGNYSQKSILVLKWSIWEKRLLPKLPNKTGTIEHLKLIPLNNFPQYTNDRILGTINDKSRILYLDISSIPKETNLKLIKLKSEIATRGIQKEWLFLSDDARHINAKNYWKQWTPKLTKNKTDVLDILLDFQQKLQTQGVELLLVPVPPKSTIYSDYFIGIEPSSLSKQNNYINLLKKKGLDVLNLQKEFLLHRKNNSRELFCKTDSHWSPEACNLTASLISNIIKNKKWYPSANKNQYDIGLTSLIEIQGDLTPQNSTPNQKLETLPIEYVTLKNNPISKTTPNSPIILLGDSHNLVFSDAKTFFTDGAGLPDYLALHSGIAVDVVATLGSGLNGARGSLYRNRSINPKIPNYWKGKKLLIWCFTERELSATELNKNNLNIPLTKP